MMRTGCRKSMQPRSSLVKWAPAILVSCLLAPASSEAEELSGSVTVYGWLPWIDGEVTSKRTGSSAETSISAGDVLEALEFAFMAAGEVHYGRFGFLHDTLYSKLGTGGELSGPFSSDVDVDTEMLIATNALGYQVYVQEGWLLEPFAGARYVRIETDVTVTGGGPLGLSRSADVDVDWWEPLVGVRGRAPLTDKLSAGGFANIGGFGAGSELTWEVFGGLNYAFNDRFSSNLGFRYLSIDYEADKADVDLDTYGPVLGVTLRF